MKNEDEDDKKYLSVVEEMRRYVRHNRKIHVYYKDSSELFDDLMITLRKQYVVPNKDFSLIGTSFMVENSRFVIEKFKKPTEFVISTKTKDGYHFTTSFLIKKTLFRQQYFVRYLEVAKAPQTVWGMKASIAKWWYKRTIKQNVKLIKEELKQIKNSKLHNAD